MICIPKVTQTAGQTKLSFREVARQRLDQGLCLFHSLQRNAEHITK